MISRRDFLKMAAAAAGAAALPAAFARGAESDRPNIVIFLCDAFSARHASLYGYPRRTTPFLDQFAEKATVYHNHYSGSNYTTTGTASMLTGMLPWKHRAINYGGLVAREFAHDNPFTLLGSAYERLAFAQNPWPERLMGQYSGDVDRFLSYYSYSLLHAGPAQNLFQNDFAVASVALDDFSMAAQHGAYPGSSIFDYLFKSAVLSAPDDRRAIRYRAGFPEIMDPGYYVPYLNEEVYDGVFNEITDLQAGGKPYFAYFHLYSPHFPYRPRNDYRQRFNGDGYVPVVKPVHPLAGGDGLSQDYLNGQHDLYDRQISQIDDEFGFLLSRLESSGALDNTYFIFTSDHGELFERGFVGHGFQFLYEPVVKIPLIIRAPGQTRRVDVDAPTSNTDILPTLLSIANKEIPAELDGLVLPELGGTADPDRAIFSMVAVDNSSFGPLYKAVVSMRKGIYKIIGYFGYDLEDEFELFHLDDDPEELNSLVKKSPDVFSLMKDELLAGLNESNKPFLR